MMNVPVGEPGAKFELKAGTIEQNGINIPVFEAKALKEKEDTFLGIYFEKIIV